VDVKCHQGKRRAGSKTLEELEKTHDELEKIIAARTAELSLAIQALEAEVAEHQKVREEISIAYDALNSTTSGIIITDLDHCIRFANPACLHMLKYDALSDIFGLNASGLFSTEKDRKFSGIKMAVEHSMGDPQELILQCADGTAFPVEAVFSVVTESANSGGLSARNRRKGPR
jgi:PAS domain-containing protein